MACVRRVRNFCIVAHIDHGKSTLADRLIERTRAVEERLQRAQMTDNMELERERGITIKSHAVCIPYTDAHGTEYVLNFVDTPGHADFAYEVSRAIAACEGALLVVDATQGVESQTISNLYLVLEHDLEIIPVINKIDLPTADVPRVLQQVEHDLGLDPASSVLISAKTGENVDALFDAIITRIPPPRGRNTTALQALVFDCHYDQYRGVVVHIRVFEGQVTSGMVIRFMSNGAEYRVEETGVFVFNLIAREALCAGDVGYLSANVKTVSDVQVGDTITDASCPCDTPRAGFRRVKPVVFSSVYPVDTDECEQLREALERLALNDASISWERDSSLALGHGFRCGFLGLLHLEVVQQRLEREFNQTVIFTAPQVQYYVFLKTGQRIVCDNPAHYPLEQEIAQVHEPYIRATIITSTEVLGAVMTLCIEKRAYQTAVNYLDQKRVELVYEMPLAEILFGFYDRLKSTSHGYASFDYELIESKLTDLVKVDILINGKPVDALAQLCYRPHARRRAQAVCARLKEEISRQQFKIAIQGSIGGRIISRETVSPFRKDVLAKCYGGDITRKRKLLEKQKEGKKRMKMVGDVEIPQAAFLSVLKEASDA